MIYLGADHRGYALKEKIKEWLKEWNYEFEDLGNQQLDLEDDYSAFGIAVAQKVVSEVNAKGIVICGSGVGIDVAANKVKGVFCGLGFNQTQVRLAREHDDINCLSIPADFLDEEIVKDIIKTFLETPFSEEERHKRRIEKIRDYEAARS